MILIDLQQCMIANLHMQLKNHTNAQLDENMLRHMVLNSLRAYNLKFRAKYGEMVIACDDRQSWRRELFPYYKVRRKTARDKSELDWPTIHSAMENIKSELAEYFPYRVIGVNKAEADDIIGALAKEFGETEPVLIVSGDKDFKQLAQYKHVEIFDPIKKIMVKVPNWDAFLWELVMRGDAGDDVPNVLSNDDCFVTGTRQKQMRETKLEELRWTEISEWPEHVRRNYYRNKSLIDLSCMPEEIYREAIAKYHEQAGKNRSKLFNYFIKYRLSNLMESVSEF